MTAIDRWRVKWWLRDCESVGEGVYLRGHPTIYAAPGRIRIGAGVSLSSTPMPSHLVAGPEGLLDIGDGVSIGHGAAIAAYEHVRIGAATQIGPYAVIMDTNFHGSSGGRSIQHDTRPIVVGRDCRIGSRVTLTRGASIGDGAEILAGSVVSSPVPAGACAGGARARVLGRAGEAAAQWDGVFAQLPEVVRVEMALDSSPDLDTPLDQLPDATPGGRLRLAKAIVDNFGVAVDPLVIVDAQTLGDVARTILRASQRRGIDHTVRPG